MHAHPLSGIVVPIVTPMAEPGVVDPGAVGHYLDALAQAGVTRIMAFGSNGEGATLSTDDSVQMLEVILEHWSAVPNGEVLAAVISPSTSSAVQRAASFRESGVRNLVISPPIFFRHSTAELIAHFEQFAFLGPHIGAYDNRRYSGNPLTPEVVEALVGMPHMIGIKDSSGSLENLRTSTALSQGRDDFIIAQGDDREIVAAVRSGAGGATAGAANLLPRVALDIWDAAQRGDMDAASEQQELLRRVTEIHAVRPGIATTKFALASRGITPAHASLPFLPLTEQEQAEVTAILTELEGHLIGGGAP